MDPSLEQQPFGAVEFIKNPEMRCPCILLLDTSGSMSGNKIDQLNEGLRVFERETSPDLPEGVDKLVLELVTLDFAQQNEVWTALRITHHPSILYRVKLITLRDQDVQTPPKVDEAIVELKTIP